MTFNSPGEPGQPGRRPFSTGRKRPKALIPTLVILVMLVVGFGIFTDFVTDLLWFRSVGFRPRLHHPADHPARAVRGVRAAHGRAGGARTSSSPTGCGRHTGMSAEQQSLDRYRDLHRPVRGSGWSSSSACCSALLAGASAAAGSGTPGCPGATGTSSAPTTRSSAWTSRSTSSTTRGGASSSASRSPRRPGSRSSPPSSRTTCSAGCACRARASKSTPAAPAHLSVLLGLFVLLKAVAYWLDRYGLGCPQHELFTGARTPTSTPCCRARRS